MQSVQNTHTHRAKKSTEKHSNYIKHLQRALYLRNYETRHCKNYLVGDKAVCKRRIPRSCYRRGLDSNFLSVHGTSLALEEPQNIVIVSHPA